MYSKDKGSLAARRKQKKEEVKDEGNGEEKKTTSALLRIEKDMTDLELPSNVELKKEDEYNYSFVITATEGYWKGGVYEFKFSFPQTYPFSGPKVTLVDKIYHPNIDLEGGVCVSALRPWKPTYSTQFILFGLLFLFSHPNPLDPLNNEAAKEMRESPERFARNVINSMKGIDVNGVRFPKNRGIK